MSRVYIFIVVMIVWLSGSAQPNAFLDVFNSPSYSGASIGFNVIDVNTGEVLSENDSKKILIPASIQKLITTSTALEVLGDDFQYQTKLFYKGEIKDSILYGDLLIVGSGDPTFSSRYFNRENPFNVWTKILKEKGVKSISGNVLYNDSHYSSTQIPDTWVWGDIGNYYGAGVSGLNYSDNTVFVEFSSKGSGTLTSVKSIIPKFSEIAYKNRVMADNIRSDQAYIFGGPEMNNRYITGRIPQNRTSFKVKGSVPNPGYFTASNFKSTLENNDFILEGDVINFSEDLDSTYLLIDSYKSPKLADIVYQINQRSVNLFAEGLIRELAKQKTNSTEFSSGASYIKNYWANKGIYTQHLFIKDGSGLSRFNGVSASTMTDLLRKMKDNSTFYKSLPIAGVSGTLKNMLKGTSAENNLRAKSGSMERVRSYAGYVTTNSGRELAFTIILNNYTSSSYQVKKDLESFMKLLTEL